MIIQRKSSEIYPKKRCQRAILIKSQSSENLDLATKLEDHLQELLKQKKTSQDITTNNALQKVPDKFLDVIGPL